MILQIVLKKVNGIVRVICSEAEVGKKKTPWPYKL